MEIKAIKKQATNIDANGNVSVDFEIYIDNELHSNRTEFGRGSDIVTLITQHLKRLEESLLAVNEIPNEITL